MIFQNPHSSLNPRMTVKDIIGSGMKLHGLATDKDVDQKVEAILKASVRNRDHMSRFPHEFSGGQETENWYCQGISGRTGVCDPRTSQSPHWMFQSRRRF